MKTLLTILLFIPFITFSQYSIALGGGIISNIEFGFPKNRLGGTVLVEFSKKRNYYYDVNFTHFFPIKYTMMEGDITNNIMSTYYSIGFNTTRYTAYKKFTFVLQFPFDLIYSDIRMFYSNNMDRKGHSVLFSLGGDIGIRYNIKSSASLMVSMGLRFRTPLYDPLYVLNRDIASIAFPIKIIYKFDFRK